MPHLSPMNWLFALTSFWFILLLISSIQWWNQSPSFPNKAMKSQKTSNSWKWSL